MARRNLETLSRRARLGLRQQARRQALLVPRRRLDEAVDAFVQLHVFVLWVRSATEFEERIPEAVLALLEARCPDFLAVYGAQPNGGTPESLLWRDLEEWIATEYFGDAKSDRWFDAIMFYAYSDLRVEQAWTVWHRRRDLLSSGRMQGCPSFEVWKKQVSQCEHMAVAGSEKDRAVNQLTRVDSARLEAATDQLIEQRGYVFWLAGIADAAAPLFENMVHSHFPGFPPINTPVSFLFRLIRFAERQTWAAVRAEGWSAALRYRLVHSSRYHRLVHFLHKCREDCLDGRPSSFPSCDDWLLAADEYVVATDTCQLGGVA